MREHPILESREEHRWRIFENVVFWIMGIILVSGLWILLLEFLKAKFTHAIP